MFEAEDHSDTIQQLSLFLEENILLNGAIQDLHALRLEEAKKAFHEYQDIYPNGEAVDDKLAKHQPFRLDHIMEVMGIESEEDDRRGVIVQVKEAKKTGYVPLYDLEVTSREDRNFWPVREYVVWDANR